MKFRLYRQPIRAIALTVIAQSVLLFGSAATDNEAANVLPLGTVRILGSVTCPPGASRGALCKSIRVSCNGIPDLDATLASSQPAGTPRGTIVMHGGAGGTVFLNGGFSNRYLDDGFRVVQLAWKTDWEDTGGIGLKSAACRPATVFKFAFNTLHRSSRTAGFCGQGISGGGAALAFSLAHYGLSDYYDYVVIAAGPGVARMDYGCDAPLYTGPPRNLCPLLTDAPYKYNSGTKMNTWEGTSTCATPNPPQADIDRWAADSIVTTGASYSYPKTGMSWFFCVTPPSFNESTGQGSFLIEKATPKNFPPDVNCYSGSCQAEAVWKDPAAFNDTHSEMLAQCVPNH
jgi:hypothetical protein